MAESATELSESRVLPADSPPPQPNSTGVPVHNLTPEELVAKAIAPVKKQFLRPPPTRANQNDTVKYTNERSSQQHSSTLVKEKKSKRQLKRERRQVIFFPCLQRQVFFFLGLKMQFLFFQTYLNRPLQ